jgi:hypothetical protein
MIEIKCNESQKATIIKSLLMGGDCLFSWDVDCTYKCVECMEKNIKWTIRGNEDAKV